MSVTPRIYALLLFDLRNRNEHFLKPHTLANIVSALSAAPEVDSYKRHAHVWSLAPSLFLKKSIILTMTLKCAAQVSRRRPLPHYPAYVLESLQIEPVFTSRLCKLQSRRLTPPTLTDLTYCRTILLQESRPQQVAQSLR